MKNICSKCKKELNSDETYEYRGAFSCEEHFDEVIKNRDYERSEVIEELNHKNKPLQGLSFGDSVIGRTNREILKGAIEVAGKESYRLKKYEGRV